jgi:hypothetical protein
MKLLLLIGCCITSSAIFAQYKNPKVFKYDAFQGNQNLHVKSLPSLASGLQPGVHLLPFDKMPCFVPDTRAVVAMPNAWTAAIVIPFRSSMPNAAQPNQNLKGRTLKVN